ncbi:MAG: ankyrin repeat domain-containing protein, partial [Candidatus Thorarchaeota archaeon]
MTEENDKLLAASESGNIIAVEEALNAGAVIDAQNEFLKNSALHLAASKGHLDIVKFLVDSKANLLLTNGTDMTPLHLAARDGQTHVVKFLLEKMNKIPERILNDIIHVASMSVYGRPEIIQMLDDFRTVQARPSTSGKPKADSVLLEASEDGNQEDALQALKEGANVNVVDGRGMMPIHWAALRGHKQIVQILLENKAKVNSTNTAEWTPIMHASFEGYAEIVKMLLDEGAEVNARTYVSGTALMFAAGKGHIEIVRLLLDAGADATVEIDGSDDEDGTTAVEYARR